jgi:two-component system LytT family response regulator
MSKLKLLIVDDEEPARKKLNRQLTGNSQVEIIGEARDGPEALRLIEEQKPDVVMLDIQMPGMNGFDVVRLMQEPHPQVIFVTAYDEHAIKAFEVAAADYLLKPVSDSRLLQALDKVKLDMANQVKHKATEILDVLEPVEFAQRLAVRRLNRVKLIQVSDICYVTSEHRVVYVVDNSGEKNWTNETLDQLMRRLDPDQFFRIHRSSIINLSVSFEIEPWEDGRLKILFPDGVELVAAREPALALRKALGF